jgi:hypothetical protein
MGPYDLTLTPKLATHFSSLPKCNEPVLSGPSDASKFSLTNKILAKVTHPWKFTYLKIWQLSLPF